VSWLFQGKPAEESKCQWMGLHEHKHGSKKAKVVLKGFGMGSVSA
jgi:hypothetical protein